VKRFLAAHRVGFDYVDIHEHPAAIERLMKMQAGGQIIPMVVFEDRSHEVNPSDEMIAARVGLTQEGVRGRFSAVVARDRESGETHRFAASAVFVFIGLDPNSGLLRARAVSAPS